MKNISKGKLSIYLFNAYSNLDKNAKFISGSDRVGLKFIENEPNVIVIAPLSFKNLTKPNVTFISSEVFEFKNLYLRYFFRTLKTIKILGNIGKKSDKIKIVSTSDFFPDVIPCFLYSWKFIWYAFTYHLYPSKVSLRDLTGRFLQLFSFLLFKFSNKVITTSRECENFLRKNFHLSNLQIIPLGINLDLYSGDSNKNNDLVFLGRIKKSKGVFELPEMIFNLKKDFPKIKLNIIGNGFESDLKTFMKMIQTYKISKNIEVLNNLSDSEVINILKKSKILVQPSYEEGFGLSVLEALVSGMSVVCYHLPVYDEHFLEYQLNKVKIGDRLAFQNEVKTLLDSTDDLPKKNLSFSKFDWDSIFNKIFRD